MSNRKESIKKTLGISEYPWSSDDDDETPSVQVVRTQQGAADVVRVGDPSTPGPSGSASVSRARPSNHGGSDNMWSLSLNPPRPSTVTVRRNRDEMALNFIPRSASANERTGAQDVQRVLAFRSLRRQPLPVSTVFGPSYVNGIPRAPTGASHFAHERLMRDSEQTFIAEIASRMRQSISPTQCDMSRQTTSNSVYLENALQSTPLPASSTRSEITLDLETEAAAEEADGSGAPQETSAMSLEEEVVEIDAEPEPAAELEPEPEPKPELQQSTTNDVHLEEPTPTTSAATDPQSQPQPQPQPHGVKRKRESDEENNEITSVKEFNQSLLRLLECPVCLEWMEPPMWQCRRGHLVCGRCRARLTACPVCRTAFSSVRNRAMEGVAEMIRYPCRHGCGRDLQLRRRGTHEASCAARRYLCPAPACDQRPPFPHPDLMLHIQSKHLSMVKVGRKHKFSMKVNSEQHDNWIISALHQLFHLRVDVDIRTWGVVVYVAYIGPKCNADDYTYEVTVIGQHNSRKLVYTRATHCDLECSTLNVSRQDCFHLTLDQALNFLRVKNRHCEPDKYLNFNVEISSNTSQEDSDS